MCFIVKQDEVFFIFSNNTQIFRDQNDMQTKTPLLKLWYWYCMVCYELSTSKKIQKKKKTTLVNGGPSMTVFNFHS